MEIIQSIILGIVQGASEFLPISSSGHLVLMPRIFGWQDQGLAFDVALHWGTLLAVVSYFWKEWRDMIGKSYLINKIINPKSQIPNPKQIQNSKFSACPKTKKSKLCHSEHQRGICSLSHFYKFRFLARARNDSSWTASSAKGGKIQNSGDEFKNSKYSILNTKYLKKDLLFIIIIATIPGIFCGVFLNDYAETIFRNPLLVAATLLIGAILLFYSDKIGIKEKNINDITLRNGIIIGLAQALAIFPGVSRSGITITAALFLGLSRTSAAKFSFLLSAPIILGAGIKEFPVLLREGIGSDLIFGTLMAAISGYLAIKYMLKYLENKSYNIFVGYRIALALIIIILFL